MVHFGVDDLHRQKQRQLGERGGLISVDLRSHPDARSFDSQGHAPGRGFDFAEHHEAFSPMPNQVLQASSPERAAAAEHIDGLEQAGLAGSVGSADQRKARVEMQFRRLQAAEIRYLQPA